MAPSPSNVARRYATLRIAREIVEETPHIRTAGASRVRRELTAEVLAAFAEGARIGNVKTAASLASKMKDLWEAFQTAPDQWEAFKNLVGVKAESWFEVTRQLPSKISHMFSEGQKWLASAGAALVKSFPPLKIYLDIGKKIPSVGHFLEKSVSYMPKPIQRAISAIATRANSMAAWVDDIVKQHRIIVPAAGLISAAIFAKIWFNTTEISWDLPEIIRGFLGLYSFTQLLRSLPEAAVGLLISLLFPGIPSGLIWNVLLPITIALRIAWLVHKEYAVWEKGSLILRWDHMGVTPPEGVPQFLRY